MTVLAIANQKGGVGKTTTAINLGAALAREGRRVVIVDCDPQTNATSALGLSPAQGRTVYDALAARTPIRACLRPTSTEGLFLVPASQDLAGAEVELASAAAREFRLLQALRDARDDFDYILLDCAPALGLLTLNALSAADAVLIPVQCEYLALEGLGLLTHTIDLVRENLNGTLLIAGLVLTMYDSRTNLSQQVVQEVRRHFPQTFHTVIPRSVRLSEAPSFGQTIFQYAPSSRGADAYRELATELLARGCAPAERPSVQATATTPAQPSYSPPPSTGSDNLVRGGIT